MNCFRAVDEDKEKLFSKEFKVIFNNGGDNKNFAIIEKN